MSWLDRIRIFYGGGSTPSASSSVPEIDASSGALALAVVAAAMLLAWEVRRRKRA
ncbi:MULTISPECIES: VPEID-CTERM sorting domain-containing protein [Marivita]|uniref:VPEID-CTERM sorting domain-containing protein n=1 Tax=Marivita cryptomonadis TaxID=505252 RepID=A0A9Q2PBZ6_9RHOB|nr:MULTISPECIES: VPEID-CTERM sorting domain-containing protein [Marivita]MCR9167659.1 VPEID-CTERM sorting domain-containing protein [Paracoccaceae bacterium]MBM2322064.1 VPEID-CTERM sorting domain-containing protein [Marivita cryptomonadis]MBM2331645.1 VPEID-CTERM sorting domain-containing protein [Marivita cryptomonadis]MBM2341230.1 VPEID-CTERM sorting domain-containing protein [Marivita cryptomonadis]MBM2345893.1 VPEID-CTERM sorting domain-containing protein [Marivita cryptomonadis]